MRIKSLQITGFKSFVDKTAFSFKPGITAIVGPNGCGKSNVVDAIRWVMGEQSPRRLRGKGMEDVIFAGSEARAPIGLAEVVLSFDNGDGLGPPQYAAYAEIQIGRRLYRSGESEYLINKTPCRLRDVQDFFRDTGIGTRGYTIVEQGRIAEIVSARPEERRILIEEAAGISKYKARRREAERKLEATDQNLTRVRDVLGEIRRQIGTIERQAKKAARYKRLRETQRLLELSLAADERREALAGLESRRVRLAALRDAATEAEARLGEREASLESQRVDLEERERELGQDSESLFRIRGQIKELESRIAYERRERAALGESAQARGREREQLVSALAAAEEDAARLADELAGVESAAAEAQRLALAAETEVARAAEAKASLEREREDASAGLVDALTAVARCEDRLAAIGDRRAELDRRLRSADEQLELQQGESDRAQGEQRRLEEGLRNLLAERDRLMGSLRDAIRRHDESVESARHAAEALRGRRELREMRRARLESLRELLERGDDMGAGARHLLELGDEERRRLGLRALVRDVLEVEPAAERAVEAVLADRAQGVVLESGFAPEAVLEALRRAQAGRGVLVLERRDDETSRGFVPLGTPLLGRVRPRPGYEAVARALLGDVNLVESLDEALQVYGSGRIPCRFVTARGDVLGPDGVVRGGGDASGSGLLGRVREVRELETETRALDEEVEQLAHALREAERTREACQDELENLRNRHHTAALAVANHEKDLERTRERVKALGEAHEGRVAERSTFLAESEALAQEHARLEARLADGREERARLQRRVDELGLRLGSAGRELSRLEALATERRVQHENRADHLERLRQGLERARSGAEETRTFLRQREAEIATAEARREELARSLEAAEQSLAGLLQQEEAARLASERRRDAYEELAQGLRRLEGEAREVRIQLEARRDEAQQAELGLREQELHLQHLEQSVREKWGVELASWKPPVPAGEAPAEPEAARQALAEARAEASRAEGAEEGEGGAPEAGLVRSEAAEDRDARREARELAELLGLDAAGRRERLAEIRQRIEAIGDVNLGAIEEHEELRERHRFLEEQKGDLETSVAQLREAIARVNRTSRKRFRETFDAVDERFQKNFPRLFRGGKASLGLTESEDVLEAGIEIMAQPPGKRLQSVNLLSGGEKTMTAIALLVSVFQVRPSPFFLLDEVDAALDDANVGRFNEIVRELAQESQFLLITHNKRTIEVADLLYGVTMQEKGVSTLVAVEVH